MASRISGENGRSASVSAPVALILIAACALAAPAVEPPVETSFDGQSYQVKCTFMFPVDAFIFGQRLGYDTVTLPDGECLDEPGRPLLPAKQLRIALPPGMVAVRARVVAKTETELAGRYDIFPAQPPRRVSDLTESGFVSPDPATYASTQTYPGRLVELRHQTDLAGQSIAIVRLLPVRYVPAERRLSACSSITFVLEGVDGYVCGDYLPDRIAADARGAYARMLREMVVNPESVTLRPAPGSSRCESGVDPGDYDYVVITRAEWCPHFQTLADWKHKKGVRATVVDRAWIYDQYEGGTNPEKIRAFVQDAHEN